MTNRSKNLVYDLVVGGTLAMSNGICRRSVGAEVGKDAKAGSWKAAGGHALTSRELEATGGMTCHF